jgi:ring-1,2-phenylacetyl-CoA epoxidase subunit PaaE
MTVLDIRRETPDAVSVGLAVEPDLAPAFAFRPGQYLTVRRDFGGEEVRRSYSICAGLDDGHLRIGVRHVPGGIFSTFLAEQLRPGDTIEAMPPNGRFGPEIDPAARHAYLGIAAGSGITPILSILSSVLTREPESRFVLVYGNRVTQSVMFAEALEDLKNRHLERLTLFHVLSREAQDVALMAGRIDAAKLAALAEGAIDIPAMDAAFLCGPRDMMRAAKAGLAELGMPAERIHMELFSPGIPAKTLPRPTRQTLAAAPIVAQIAVRLDGKRHSFDLTSEDSSLITAAARQGIDLPHSCTGGMCSTCRCRLLSGEADMIQNFALEEWELKRGFILACQAKPKTPHLELDFDDL